MVLIKCIVYFILILRCGSYSLLKNDGRLLLTSVVHCQYFGQVTRLAPFWCETSLYFYFYTASLSIWQTLRCLQDWAYMALSVYLYTASLSIWQTMRLRAFALLSGLSLFRSPRWAIGTSLILEPIWLVWDEPYGSPFVIETMGL